MSIINHFSSEDKTSWRAPSNIAIVKYWGKKGFQIPGNASLSLTLSKAYTETTVTWGPKTGKGIEFDFCFEGQRNEKFHKKMHTTLENISKELPLLHNYWLKIESHNTFPHSAGIASSASSMAALALCLVDIEKKEVNNPPDFFQRASFIARLGSGSAARSLYGGFVRWGENQGQGSDYYSHQLTSFHPIFSNLQDTILIVSSEEKQLSSSSGHNLMKMVNQQERFGHANFNFSQLLNILKSGDLAHFGKILEEEALTLHAQILISSRGSSILLKPETLEIIQKIRYFRENTGLDLYFTLDAGPNVHLLYPYSQKEKIYNFIESEILNFCESFIPDHMGPGPRKLL